VGKTLAIWSPSKKCGRTIITYNLVQTFAKLLPDKKILVLCVNMNYGNLLPLFDVRRDELTLEKAVNYKLSETAEDLDYTKVLAQQGNLYFMGSQNTTLNYANRNLATYERVINELKATFDLIVIDTCAGKNIPLSNMVIDNCTDALVNVLMQDMDIIESDFTHEKAIAYVINCYREIYPTSADIKSKYAIHNIFELPSCDIMQDMKNKKRLDIYSQYETDYSIQNNEIALHILKKLNFKPEDNALAEHKPKKDKKEKKAKKLKNESKKGGWLW